MTKNNLPEFWLRGPLNQIPKLLQPVAHALLQAREEVNELMTGFPDARLWAKAAGMASVGFHLQHLTGVLDRLFTYADGKQLTQDQLNRLASEGQAADISTSALLQQFNKQVDLSISRLGDLAEDTLTESRGVGRAQLPSTVNGLLFHAAEHTMRHTGQLLVTVKVINSQILS